VPGMRLPRLVFMALALIGGSRLAAQEGGEHGLPPGFHSLKIGESAPDFSLLGVDGKTYSLADFRDQPFLMVIFLSNHCPASHAAETRFLPFVAKLKGQGVAVVAINPNSVEGLRVEELGYSKYSDSYDEMKLYARDRGFTFPYLYDGGTQKTAKAYGCLCTPHLFIFDRERRLRYEGRFDDSQSPDPATVHSTDGANAMEALLAGQPVPVAVTRPMGCSTKWLEKQGSVAEGNEAWKNLPVSVETIDADGIADLARNSTGRLRVINLWATWCVPCVEEFPGLVSISRRLESRDFDLITISVDDPKDGDKVLKFLKREHAALPPGAKAAVAKEGRRTNNYHYTGTSDALAKALDPKWPGPYPYSVVIAPGGEIVARYVGAIDVTDLQSSLIDRLGVYYK
jgi:peroxiredoxin